MPFRSRTKKTDLAVAVAATGRYPVKAIAETLGVARSNLVERTNKSRPARTAYSKPDETTLLPLIGDLVDARPTYGYRRITALLNRQFRAAGAQCVNHKRIYRIMQLHGMLLQPYTGRRIERAHDGVVRTLRWVVPQFLSRVHSRINGEGLLPTSYPTEN